jgi:UDP:flavonoid glycosyltransferase YjiC (YdhE family)
MVVRTLTDLGLRGLVSGASPDDPLPPSILALPPVPFDRLFPRVAGVVHHGGAGTTAMALRAGVPSFGVPGFFDQPFWSARVAALGAGPRPVPARRLTEPRLRAAVAQLAGDRSLRDCAQAAARRLRSETRRRQHRRAPPRTAGGAGTGGTPCLASTACTVSGFDPA